MTRIGILSDTHSYLNPRVLTHFKDCDELWHAGDIGNLAVTDELAAFKPLKAVYGNIDNHEIRREFPLDLWFRCEGLSVWMTHIAGKPPRYTPRIREQLARKTPDILVCGHSHILKVQKVSAYNNLLHINPGAAGNKGFHRVATLVRFAIDGTKVFDFEVIEFDRSGGV